MRCINTLEIGFYVILPLKFPTEMAKEFITVISVRLERIGREREKERELYLIPSRCHVLAVVDLVASEF